MVKNLLLVRHAEALLPEPDQRDFHRSLSEYGHKQATLLGEAIANLDVRWDAIYLSPSIRTKQTCLSVINCLPGKPKLVPAEEFYEATKNMIVASALRLDDLFQNIVIIGHNPSVSLLHEYLVEDQPIAFTTGSFSWIELQIESWSHVSKGVGLLKEHYYPGQFSA